MRHQIRKYFSLFVVATAFLSAACSTMTEKEWEEREYARVEWQEQFRYDRMVCRAAGRRFIYDGSVETDRDGVPKSRVFYACS